MCNECLMKEYIKVATKVRLLRGNSTDCYVRDHHCQAVD